MDVAVIGCGPAGLLAAYAVEQAGHMPTVMSVPRKSVIAGAQYLHDAIPGLTGAKPDADIEYVKRGTKEGYAAKVYGSPEAPCSWDRFRTGLHPAWALEPVYDRLWDRMSAEIEPMTVGAERLDELADVYDLVLCTAPAKAVCRAPESHRFGGQQVCLATDFSYVDWNNLIVYDGTEEFGWYRSSMIFGHESVEWSCHRAHPYVSGMVCGVKPLDTDCDCWTGHSRVRQLGRFGQWKKSVLITDAYHEAVELLN